MIHIHILAKEILHGLIRSYKTIYRTGYLLFVCFVLLMEIATFYFDDTSTSLLNLFYCIICD